MKIGKHFYLKEFTDSDTAKAKGISNFPGLDELRALKFLVDKVLDPLRDAVGIPVRITSGYRSPCLNKAIGGSATSDHVLGRASDIKADGLDATQLMREVLAAGLEFDQMIGYVPEKGGHVHISWRESGNRKEILWVGKSGKYVKWKG